MEATRETPRHRDRGTSDTTKEMVLMMADYNGWTDEREEEREALDQLEMAVATVALNRRRLLGLRRLLVRAAAREIVARSAA
jgi:hypothetical protein